eukprot:421303_1
MTFEIDVVIHKFTNTTANIFHVGQKDHGFPSISVMHPTKVFLFELTNLQFPVQIGVDLLLKTTYSLKVEITQNAVAIYLNGYKEYQNVLQHHSLLKYVPVYVSNPWIKNSNITITNLQIKNYVQLQVINDTKFDDAELKIEMNEHDTTDTTEPTKLLTYAMPHEIPDHIVNALKAINFDFSNVRYNEELKKHSFMNTLNQLTLPIEISETYETVTFIEELESLGVSNSIASKLYLFIKQFKSIARNIHDIPKFKIEECTIKQLVYIIRLDYQPIADDIGILFHKLVIEYICNNNINGNLFVKMSNEEFVSNISEFIRNKKRIKEFNDDLIEQYEKQSLIIYDDTIMNCEIRDFVDTYKHKIAFLELQNYKFNFPSIDIIQQQLVFGVLYRKQLMQFYEPIAKQKEATTQDFIDVAYNINLFDGNVINNLCEYLLNKLMSDIEYIKPWECNHCSFINRKQMVGGLWRLYNQLNQCGLCGDLRNQSNQNNNTNNNIIQQQNAKKFELPEVVSTNWSEIEEDECNYGKEITSIKECDSEQVIYLLEHYFIDNINHETLTKNKTKIVQYFKQNHINGMQILSMNKPTFLSNIIKHCNGLKKWNGPLKRLYLAMHRCKINEIGKVFHELPTSTNFMNVECGPKIKLTIIVDHFECLTQNLSNTNYKYPYDMKLLLSAFEEYTTIHFLNDIEHIIAHKPLNIQYCKQKNDCIHYKRTSRDRNVCKELITKKK